MRNKGANIIVVVMVLTAVIVVPASAKGSNSAGAPGVTQTFSTMLKLPAIPSPGINRELCVGFAGQEVCETVALDAIPGSSLKLLFTYALSNGSSLPPITANAGDGIPCPRQGNPTTVSDGVGVYAEIANAVLQSGSTATVVLYKDGVPIGEETWGPAPPQPVPSQLSASLC